MLILNGVLKRQHVKAPHLTLLCIVIRQRAHIVRKYSIYNYSKTICKSICF